MEEEYKFKKTYETEKGKGLLEIGAIHDKSRKPHSRSYYIIHTDEHGDSAHAIREDFRNLLRQLKDYSIMNPKMFLGEIQIEGLTPVEGEDVEKIVTRAIDSSLERKRNEGLESVILPDNQDLSDLKAD